MIPLGAGVRALAYCAPVDMRKGFEGLWALVTQQLQREVLSGELFVFVGALDAGPRSCTLTAPACACCTSACSGAASRVFGSSPQRRRYHSRPPSCSCF